jgi:hypothetical protein
LAGVGELGEEGVNAADCVDVGGSDVVQVGLFILDCAVPDFHRQSGVLLAGLVLVEVWQFFRSKPPVLEGFSCFKQEFE